MEENINKLLELLLERTQDNTLKWEESVERDNFYCFIRENMIDLSVDKYPYTCKSTVIFSIYNSEDTIILQLKSNPEEKYSDLIIGLYDAIRRRALRICEIIKNIMEDLENYKSDSDEKI